MYQSRKQFALIYMAGFQHYIFAIGGLQCLEMQRMTLDNCEVFDCIQNQWTEIAPMNHSRSCAGACAFQDKFVYVFGGYQYDSKSNNFTMLKSIEKYNIELNFWTELNDI